VTRAITRYGITTDDPNKWRYFLDSVEVHLPPFWEQHINDENSVELIPPTACRWSLRSTATRSATTRRRAAVTPLNGHRQPRRQSAGRERADRAVEHSSGNVGGARAEPPGWAA
jgi:hypothetical protein